MNDTLKKQQMLCTFQKHKQKNRQSWMLNDYLIETWMKNDELESLYGYVNLQAPQLFSLV